MPKISEVDPLLPHNEPSPEISGYGSSSWKRRPEVKYDETVYVGVAEEGAGSQRPTEQVKSVWSNIIGAFTFIVLFSFVVAAISSRSQTNQPWPSPIHPVPGRPGTGRPAPTHTIEERVHKILTETPLIDGHNDLAIFIRARYKNAIHSQEFKDKFENGGMSGDVDLPRLRSGMVGGAFWSAFVICPNNASTDFSDEEYAVEVAHTIQQIDMIKRLQSQYNGNFTPAGTDLPTMLAKFHATRSLFGPISIEGLHQVSQSSAMATLRLYHALGVKAATLTWNCHNAFADAALISSNGKTQLAPYHRGGLTAKGREVVKEMNRLGMLVDISHTSYWTQKAVLSNGTSRSPVIFSHSSAFELCPHPRNVKDDVLQLVKDTDSLVMVNFSPDFISCKGDGEGLPEFVKQNNTLHQVARHITYIGDKIGYDHVGLGSDYDGMGALTPKGLEGVDKFPDLIAELLKMGVSDSDAGKIVGGNLLRVWRAAEEVSAEMHKEGVLEGQDEIEYAKTNYLPIYACMTLQK